MNTFKPLQDITPLTKIIATGGEKEISVGWLVTNYSNIIIYKNNILMPSSEYTVRTLDSTVGANITLKVPLIAQDNIVITRETILEKTTDYQPNIIPSADGLNIDTTRPLMGIQELRAQEELRESLAPPVKIYLDPEKNLSDLTDINEARNTLDVYKKSEQYTKTEINEENNKINNELKNSRNLQAAYKRQIDKSILDQDKKINTSLEISNNADKNATISKSTAELALKTSNEAKQLNLQKLDQNKNLSDLINKDMARKNIQAVNETEVVRLINDAFGTTSAINERIDNTASDNFYLITSGEVDKRIKSTTINTSDIIDDSGILSPNKAWSSQKTNAEIVKISSGGTIDLSKYCAKSENLSGLTNYDTARNTLDVYKKSEINNNINDLSNMLTKSISDLDVKNTQEHDVINKDIKSNETNIQNISNHVISLETGLGDAERNITMLQGNVTTLQGDVTTNTTSISTLNTDVAANTKDITTLQGDVATLNTEVGDIEKNLNISKLKDTVPVSGYGFAKISGTPGSLQNPYFQDAVYVSDLKINYNARGQLIFIDEDQRSVIASSSLTYKGQSGEAFKFNDNIDFNNKTISNVRTPSPNDPSHYAASKSYVDKGHVYSVSAGTTSPRMVHLNLSNTLGTSGGNILNLISNITEPTGGTLSGYTPYLDADSIRGLPAGKFVGFFTMYQTGPNSCNAFLECSMVQSTNKNIYRRRIKDGRWDGDWENSQQVPTFTNCTQEERKAGSLVLPYTTSTGDQTITATGMPAGATVFYKIGFSGPYNDIYFSLGDRDGNSATLDLQTCHFRSQSVATGTIVWDYGICPNILFPVKLNSSGQFKLIWKSGYINPSFTLRFTPISYL